MSYPKWSLITAITFLLGMYPIHEHRRSHWQKKIILPGFLLTISHTLLLCYTFILETKRVGFFNSHPNNVIQATLVIQQLLAVLMPLVCIFGKFCYIKSWEELWDRSDLFDELIKSADHQVEVNFRCSVADLEEQIHKTNFYCGLCVIFIEIFNIFTSYLYFSILPPREIPLLQTIYFYHFASSTFISGTMNIAAHMYNMKLRFQLLSKFLDGVWSTACDSESDDLKSNRQRLFNQFIEDKALEVGDKEDQEGKGIIEISEL